MRTPTPKMGAHLGMCGFIPSHFSYTFRNMKCDSQASLLAHTFASPYLGDEPKARVVTPNIPIKCYIYKAKDHNIKIWYPRYGEARPRCAK
jgi:hypothetical protein